MGITKIGTTVTIAAAHFVQTTDTPCKRIHGHNWKVEVEILGNIQNDGMVLDFTIIKSIINKLDHRLLIPGQSIGIVKSMSHKHLVELYDLKTQHIYALVPKESIHIIDVPVITAEYLAQYIHNQIKKSVTMTLIVKVWESEKSYAEF